MFADAVEKMLRETVSPEMVRRAELGDWPAPLWSFLEENGVTLTAAPESCGGIGVSWSECYGIVKATGFYTVPVPLAESMTVNWLLGLHGVDAVSGPASLGVAAGGKIEGGCFTGSVHNVAWGRNVDHLLVQCGTTLMLLATADARIEAATNIAGEPRDTLHFSGVEGLASMEAERGVEAVMIAGAMQRAAQIAGALQRLRELVVEYALQREQFGRPIAKFQAIQHQIAQLAEHAALAGAGAAAAFAQESLDGAFAAAAAKQVASEAAGEGAALAHAVFGAIGFSEEYDLQLLTRRLWSWRAEFGSMRYWADAIGAAVARQGGTACWPSMVDQSFELAKVN